MKQVILIHGLPSEDQYKSNEWPSPSNSHWFSWIQKQLTRKGMLCQSLEMPRPYNPNYKDYCEVLDQINITDETILVGHSCGGGFLVRYFSEHKELHPKKIILVAPWLDIDGELKELDSNTTFFNFDIDSDLSKRTHIDVIYSTDDDKDIKESIELIKNKVHNIEIHIFSDKGHFTERDLGTKEFPELIDIIRK